MKRTIFLTTLVGSALACSALAQDEKKEAAPAAAPAADVKADGSAEKKEPREVVLKQDAANPLAFAENEFTVKAGESIKLVMDNTTASVPQPHNVLVCKPGSLKEVCAAALASIADPKYMTGGCVPTSDKILHIIKLVQPGQKDSVEFEAPEEAGDYPFVCTFPGHWTTMNGVMTVEAAEGEKKDGEAKEEGKKAEAGSGAKSE